MASIKVSNLPYEIAAEVGYIEPTSQDEAYFDLDEQEAVEETEVV